MIENVKKTCIKDTLGDGNCDSENNIADCNYDEGDCCASSCLENCSAGNCPFECGSKNPYECIDPNNGCYDCETDTGDCLESNSCFESDDDVFQAVHN